MHDFFFGFFSSIFAAAGSRSDRGPGLSVCQAGTLGCVTEELKVKQNTQNIHQNLILIINDKQPHLHIYLTYISPIYYYISNFPTINLSYFCIFLHPCSIANPHNTLDSMITNKKP